MRRRDTILLLALAGLVYLIVSLAVAAPGYMDADYYFVTARQLAAGKGFSEPFIWNYLDDPSGLPHPSHTYWMPLTSVVAAGAMALFGDDFRAAQFPMFLSAVLLPLLAVSLARRFDADRRLMLSAGLISIFCGFFVPYFVTTDSFTIYAWIGSAVLLLSVDASRQSKASTWFIVGVLAGLGYLTRADGVLLLLPAAVAIWWSGEARLKAVVSLAFGYLLCTGPWFVRNLIATGHVFPAGAGHTLWLLSYNELFSYPASQLTLGHWWQAGIGEILSTRRWALGLILQRLVAESGLVFMWPFMIVGAYHLRKRREIRLAVLYLVLLVGLMTVVFPFAGAFGGFFHSSVALLPILCAIAPIGLDRSIDWFARIRKWDGAEAKKVLNAGALVLLILLSVGLTWSRVVGVSISSPRWEGPQRTYETVGEALSTLGRLEDIVVVNNPPGFFLATGMKAVVIPNGTPQTLHAVIDRYHVRWVILDVNHPDGLDALYTGAISPNWLELELTTQDAIGDELQIWKVVSSESTP
jgi:4-amino-4-deoxy-L-arabinose transferase-like glycosyltransferase